jgi:hypothetical protein
MPAPWPAPAWRRPLGGIAAAAGSERLAKEMLTRLQKADAANKFCADCGGRNPQWAAVTFGGLVCLECSGAHRGLGVQTSFVQSVQMDAWRKPRHLAMMVVGGNAALNTALRAGGVPEGDVCGAPGTADPERLRRKYTSAAAARYHDELEVAAEAAESAQAAQAAEAGVGFAAGEAAFESAFEVRGAELSSGADPFAGGGSAVAGAAAEVAASFEDEDSFSVGGAFSGGGPALGSTTSDPLKQTLQQPSAAAEPAEEGGQDEDPFAVGSVDPFAAPAPAGQGASPGGLAAEWAPFDDSFDGGDGLGGGPQPAAGEGGAAEPEERPGALHPTDARWELGGEARRGYAEYFLHAAQPQPPPGRPAVPASALVEICGMAGLAQDTLAGVWDLTATAASVAAGGGGEPGSAMPPTLSEAPFAVALHLLTLARELPGATMPAQLPRLLLESARLVQAEAEAAAEAAERSSGAGLSAPADDAPAVPLGRGPSADGGGLQEVWLEKGPDGFGLAIEPDGSLRAFCSADGRPLDGSAAERAGVRLGSRVTAVNGVAVAGREAVVAELRRPAAQDGAFFAFTPPPSEGVALPGLVSTTSDLLTLTPQQLAAAAEPVQEGKEEEKEGDAVQRAAMVAEELAAALSDHEATRRVHEAEMHALRAQQESALAAALAAAEPAPPPEPEPMAGPMTGFDEAAVLHWVGAIPGLSLAQREAIQARLGAEELDGEELETLREKRLGRLLRGTAAEGAAPLLLAARDDYLATREAAEQPTEPDTGGGGR